jgi:hypothetical protein
MKVHYSEQTDKILDGLPANVRKAFFKQAKFR